MAFLCMRRFGQQLRKPTGLTLLGDSRSFWEIPAQPMSERCRLELSSWQGFLPWRRQYVACLKKSAVALSLNWYEIKDIDEKEPTLVKKNEIMLNSIRLKTAASGNVVSLSELTKESGSVVSELTKDIDLDALREEVKRERETQGKPLLLNDRLQEIIAQRCDAAIASLSPEDNKKLKVIQLEHNFMYSEGNSIPSSEEMTSQNWLEAMNAPSKSQRLKYYLYLSKRRYIKESDRKKKEERKEQQKDPTRRMDLYEHGRVFMRIYDSTIKKWQHYRLSTAMQFGIPLVIDMDYAKHMAPREIKNTAEQMLDLYCLNRADEKMPFHLHLTSCKEDNPIYRLMQIGFQDQDFLATVTKQSYLDMFDRDRLVYLSPEGRQVLRAFDPTAIYIIGAFNDKGTQKPVSFARAKEQDVRCMRLPIDEYLDWNLGVKGLTLDQMMKIMTSVKNEQPWTEAFRAIPQRKVRAKQVQD